MIVNRIVGVLSCFLAATLVVLAAAGAASGPSAASAGASGAATPAPPEPGAVGGSGKEAPQAAPAAPSATGAPAASPAPKGTAVRIVRPRAIDIVTGPTVIEVDPGTPPDGAQPFVVEVSVDGKSVARIETPPYQVSFDFGTALGARTITARIVSGTGEGAKAAVTTRGFDVRAVQQTARVDLVSLYVSVRDGSGKYRLDLARDQFKVTEEGRPQSLSYFSLERRPMSAAVVLDTSYSMRGEPIEAARAAATRFIQTMGPEDRVLIASFSDEVRILTDLTADRKVAAAAVATVEAKGGTALYDAIYNVSDRLSREEGRKTIILLSDGRDEAENGIEPGSLHTFEESLEKALRSEVTLFTIGFGKRLETEMDFLGRVTLRQILDRLAGDSGGTSHYPQRASALRTAYELIGEELRSQYNLAYSPEPLRLDGQWHPLRVEMTDPSLKAITRRGYYAPKG